MITRSFCFFFKINHRQLILCMLFTLVLSNGSARENDDLITQLTDSLEKTADPCEKASFYNKLARTYVSIDLQKAMEQANLGIELGKKYGCIRQLGFLFNSSSVIQIYSGNNAAAFGYIDSAIAVYTYLDYKKGLAGAKGNKGTLYNKNGDYDKALKYLYESMHLQNELGDRSGVATTLTNIFTIFYALQDFKKAHATISEAYSIFNELGELDGKAISTYNLAVLYGEMGKPDSSLVYAKQCIAFYQELGNPDDIANAYSINSFALGLNGQYRDAIAFADSAITLYEATGHARKNIEILNEKAEWHFSLGEYAQSIDIALLLVEEGKIRDLKQIERDGAKLLMNNYAATADFQKAFEYAQRYYALEGQMLNEKTLGEINRLKSEFDFERKELELEAALNETQILALELNKKNAYLSGLLLLVVFVVVIVWFILKQRRLAQRQKTAELEHKALRTQMNPHFIFNSLNSIQRMYIEGNLDEANEFTGDFAELMRKILDNSTKNLVSLEEEIELLTLYLSLENIRCKNMFDYTFDIGEGIDTHYLLIPPLIIQPFVENAIWHGILPKRQRGNIRIELRLENKLIRCTVIDDGVGFEQKKSPFHESHGIRITEQRIGRKITLESEPGKGTRVTFYILYQNA